MVPATWWATDFSLSSAIVFHCRLRYVTKRSGSRILYIQTGKRRGGSDGDMEGRHAGLRYQLGQGTEQWDRRWKGF